jgi:hypothetical protein
MNSTLRYVLITLILGAAFVAVAQASRRFDWAFGREWLTPIMMWVVLTAPLCYAAVLRKPGARPCCRVSRRG